MLHMRGSGKECGRTLSQRRLCRISRYQQEQNIGSFCILGFPDAIMNPSQSTEMPAQEGCDLQ